MMFYHCNRNPIQDIKISLKKTYYSSTNASGRSLFKRQDFIIDILLKCYSKAYLKECIFSVLLLTKNFFPLLSICEIKCCDTLPSAVFCHRLMLLSNYSRTIYVWVIWKPLSFHTQFSLHSYQKEALYLNHFLWLLLLAVSCPQYYIFLSSHLKSI